MKLKYGQKFTATRKADPTRVKTFTYDTQDETFIFTQQITKSREAAGGMTTPRQIHLLKRVWTFEAVNGDKL